MLQWPMHQDNPPQDLSEFFEWLRLRTEALWATLPEPTLSDFEFEQHRVGGMAWRPGTRWLSGLTDSEIDAVEKQWGLRFPSDYRLFLRMLHAPDRLMFRASFREGRTLFADEAPLFYNWLTDSDAIRRYLGWPLEGLVFDFVHNDLWFEDWGPRPKDEQEAERRIGALIADAPKLVPVYGHRYLVEADTPWGYVVLSIYQSDIIVYGQDLRDVLLKDLGYYSDLPGSYRPAPPLDQSVYLTAVRVPFWGRFVELTSQWQ